MRAIITAFVLCFALGLSGQSTAQTAASLTGEWHGVYAYDQRTQAGSVETEFTAQLREGGGQLVGTTVERNHFGSADAMFLLASLQGQHAGNTVTFTKTYDGTGGETHGVSYTGQLMPGGRRIVGTWRTGQASNILTGRFEMVR